MGCAEPVEVMKDEAPRPLEREPALSEVEGRVVGVREGGSLRLALSNYRTVPLVLLEQLHPARQSY